MSIDDQPVCTSAKPPMTPHGVTRRRLTKAGLGAASVLWTLDSRAQMSPMKCISPSAGFSGALSSNFDKDLTCAGGNSPGYWKNHEGWPVSRDKMFNSVFASANMLTYGSVSMLALLQGCGFDRQNNSIGKHLVATYLNIQARHVTFLSIDTLLDMWRQIDSQGYYRISPEVVWTVEETKNYLEGTYHSPDPVEQPGEPAKPEKPEKPGKDK